ncbi:MAG: DUF5131 family protein [Candidatus Scalindua sp.]
MLKHSKAKVELYTNYLSRYLNILSRADFLDKIHIYDLMCGEGIYSDGSKGSPVIALEKIRDHYYSNGKICPDLEVWFNDRDKSEIEKQKYKIEKVKEHCSTIFTPNNVKITYTQEDYVKLYPKVLQKIKKLRKLKVSIKFISVEPLLENLGAINLKGIDWVIVGGESGVKARPMDQSFVINIKKQCENQNVAFFFKQWGTWGNDGSRRSKKKNGRLLLGREWNQYPEYEIQMQMSDQV